MFGKRQIAALVAELLGTGILTLLILSVQRSTIGVPFFVAAAAGLTFALLTLTLSGASSAHFNPALTLALWTARKIDTITGVLYIAFQFLGAWGAYYLYTYFVNSSLQPVGGHFTGRIMVAEAVGTGIFAFAFAAAIYKRYSHAVASTVAGLGLMLGMIAASSAAIGLLNPAVALGIRSWVWGTYVLGPVVGAIIGVNLYTYLFANTATAAEPAKVSVPTAAKRKTTKKRK